MSGIDPKVDYAFKKLLGSESSADLLISFLNAVLDPRRHRRIEQVEILNPFQPQETDLDKLSVLDVKARDDQGRLYNIEMQMLNSSFLTSRLLYYWARLYEDQLEAGQEYDELCPAISVCICDFTLFPQTPRHHCQFQLREIVEGFPFSDNVEVHTLELEKFRESLAGLETDLDCWLFFLRNAASWKQGELPDRLDQQVFRQAAGVLEMIQQNRYEHELYEARRKAWLDANSRRLEYERGLAKSLADGLKQGIEQGIEQGVARGEVVGEIKAFEKVLNLPTTSADLLQEMSLDELQVRRNELQSLWTARQGSGPPNS
jgi:predicted transposase/invertase (TIGR01784 family)